MPGTTQTSEYPGLIKITWDKKSQEEVKLAEKKFMEYLHKGWIAFGKTTDDKKKQIFTFDSELEEILLMPIHEGG